MAVYDDRNLGMLKYTGIHDGLWDRSERAPRGGTITFTQLVGARCRVSFTGTQFALYSSIPNGSGTVCVEFKLNSLPSELECRQYNETYRYYELWWQSSILERGAHTLIFTYRSGTERFQVDYIVINGEEEPSEASTTLPQVDPVTETESRTPTTSLSTTADSGNTAAAPEFAPTTQRSTSSSVSARSSTPDTAQGAQTRGNETRTYVTTGSSGQSITMVQTYIRSSGGALPESMASTSASPGADEVTSVSKGFPVGAIVGAALGVAAFLAFILLCLLLLRRRQNRRVVHPEQSPEPPVTPYNVPTSPQGYANDSGPNGSLVNGDTDTHETYKETGISTPALASAPAWTSTVFNPGSPQPNQQRQQGSVSNLQEINQSQSGRVGPHTNDTKTERKTQFGGAVGSSRIPNAARDDGGYFRNPRSEISLPPPYVS